MTLLIRSIQTLIRSFFRPAIKDINEITQHKFRVLPIDLDVYWHMNHAKYLNYLEAARWDLQVRSGFLKLALKKGWIGPLGHVQIDYYRPLKVFQRFEVTTQFIGFEEKWLYIVQRIWSEDKEIARALIKSTIRKGKQNIVPNEYLTPLGFELSKLRVQDDLKDWLNKRMID